MQSRTLTYQSANSATVSILLGTTIVFTVGITALVLKNSGLILLISLPVIVLVVAPVFRNQSYSLYLALVAGFLGTGLSRYVSAPTGLMVDALLGIGLAAALFAKKRSSQSVSIWLPVLFGAWMLITLFQLLNPESESTVAWFYAMRGVALYPLLIAIIGYITKPDRTFLCRFVWLWAGLSVLGTLWGLKQLTIGLDPFEQAWLAIPGNYSTHMLFGKLRVFSFFSDSGQFGAAQGHMALVATILALGPWRKRTRLTWAAIAVLGLLGLLISGTRGAMAVPAAGGLVYLILCRNWKWVLIGTTLMICVFGILKFTYVGHSIYEVRRVRTALVEGTNNPSFQIRRENQQKLAVYLKDKPFGGGIGSAGYWGKRFSPDTFLADMPLDSWYVKIWAEYGITGLWAYLLMLAWLLAAGIRTINRENDPGHRQVLLALFSGVTGILAASYGNQVFGQVPTGIIVAVSFLFLLTPRKTT